MEYFAEDTTKTQMKPLGNFLHVSHLYQIHTMKMIWSIRQKAQLNNLY